ncbi:MAG TPA: MBL fold metallo-hydrolase [Hellea balneolensis]|uniref:MBL fold metallo-hydrolase n=1 Tax=Hellea balneolensis TaxID=287478 RepID=A0A7V5NXV2_9PROT|nr:MBL fold metallo-hydrolase [Hellea balneolensis]
MSNPKVKSFFDPATNTITHIAWDESTREAAIIDPVLDYDAASGRTSTASAQKVVDFVKENRLVVKYIIETHAHADHLSAAPWLKEQIGGDIIIGKHIDRVQKVFGKIFNAGEDFATDGSQFDRLADEGTAFSLGNIPIKAIHTPGHTPACMSWLIGDAVFVGDTLFMPDYGTARCDFPGGDAATLYDSIQKLFTLPDETRVFLCHDYLPKGREEYKWETTIGEEKRNNIHVGGGTSKEEFVKMRTARDKTLSMPKLILPSVQVNMRAGHFPPAEDNGVHYLKIPLNML